MSDTIRTAPFTLTTGDYLRHYLISYFRAYITLPWALFMWPITFGFPLLAGFHDLAHHQDLTSVASEFWYSLVWLIVIPAIGAISTWRTLARNSTAYLPRTACFDGDTFAVEGDSFSNRQLWRNFRQVVETPGSLYFEFRGGCTMIVPKRALPSKTAARQFLGDARRHIGNAANRQVKVFSSELDTSEPMSGLQSPPFRMSFGVYFRYCLLLMYRSMMRPFTLLVIIASFIGFPAWLQRQSLMDGHWQSFAITTLPMPFLFALLFPFPMALLSYFVARSQPSLHGDRRVSLAADEVQARGDAYDVKVRWSNIRRVSQSWGLILLWSGPNGAIVIPRSAFADPAAADAFIDQAKALWQAAKSA